MDDARKLFLVVRRSWVVKVVESRQSKLNPAAHTSFKPEERHFVPVAVFKGRQSAEARMRELELAAARTFNPFCRASSHHESVPLRAITTWPESRLRGRLEALAGQLPEAPIAPDGPDTVWYSWWDEHAPSWPDETLAMVWELFDQVRFYAILEVDLE